MMLRRNILKQIEGEADALVKLLEKLGDGDSATITRQPDGKFLLKSGNQRVFFGIKAGELVHEPLPIASRWRKATTTREHVSDILQKELGRMPTPAEIRERFDTLTDSYFGQAPGESNAQRNFRTALRKGKRRGKRKKVNWGSVSFEDAPVSKAKKINYGVVSFDAD